MDWTYDLFVNDMNTYNIEDKDDTYYNAYFIATVKERANNFKEKWLAEHDGKLFFDHVWAGDAFAEDFLEWFSDFYKDCYRQRPHLPKWFYIHPLGLPMHEDTARLFCANPIEDAIDAAQEIRKQTLW